MRAAGKENGESIVGKRTWVQTKEGLVEVTRGTPSSSKSANIRMDIEPFKSPIDGTIVNTRAQLLAHNQRHGVTNDLDSLKEKTRIHLNSQQGHGKGETSKKERINALVEAYDRASTAGFGRNVQYHEDSQLQ